MRLYQGKMGFGFIMTNIIYLLRADAHSVININGRLNNDIPMKRSTGKCCLLNPLLFDLATHPLFCLLDNYAATGEFEKTFGIGVLYMILSCSLKHVILILKNVWMYWICMPLVLVCIWTLINLLFIDISTDNFDAFIWQGERLPIGHVFKHLGYPIVVNVSNTNLIEWVISRVRSKVNYYKATEWPLHIRLSISQTLFFLARWMFLAWYSKSHG